MKQKKFNVRGLVLLALLFAMASVLNILEGTLPPLPVPGVHIGLSNVPVMYSLFFVSPAGAFVLAILKGGLAFITRGAAAAFLSALGGILSVAVMTIIKLISKDKASVTVLSISGAVAHNIGQLMGSALMYKTLAVLGYAPVLLIAGVVSGILTAALLKLLLPALKKINR